MLIASYFGVRRPVGAFVGCDLSQPAYIEIHRSQNAATGRRGPKR